MNHLLTNTANQLLLLLDQLEAKRANIIFYLSVVAMSHTDGRMFWIHNTNSKKSICSG